MRSFLRFLLIGGATLAGCDRTPAGGSDAAAPKTTLTLAVAASMKHAVDELIADYELTNPDVDVRVTYGASGGLYAQITNAAPFDMFLSADERYPQALVDARLADSQDLFSYAEGTLVIWITDGVPVDITAARLGALRDPLIRKIANANPRLAPYGRAAEQAIERAGLGAEVKSKLVWGDNVAQAAHFAETGAAEAALIPYSLVGLMSRPGQGRYYGISADLYDPIVHGGVVVRSSPHRKHALAFRDYILGETGQSILQRHKLASPARIVPVD